jgi:hypothetical protein
MASSRRTVLEIQYNYIIFKLNNIIILCINEVNAIIIIIYGGLQDLILLFGFRMGTRKDLFEVYEQFGHAPLQSLANPHIEDNMKLTAHVSVLCIPTYVSEVLSHFHGTNLKQC